MKFLKIFGMLIPLSVFFIPSVQNAVQNEAEFAKINFSVEKGSAEFDSSRIVDGNFFSISEITSADTSMEFPSSFDMRDYGLIQNVKSQGGYGTCWAQTASDSAETSLIKRIPDIDISEWHLAYYAYSGGEQIDLGDLANTEQVFKNGGSSLIAANMWSQWKGPINETEELAYGSTEILTDTQLQEKYKDSADYNLKNAYLFDFKGDDPQTRNTIIKEFLINGNAVDISYNNDTNFYDYTNHSYMSDVKKTATHSVTIIGYDDNFPAENFTENACPENDGAWLAKNSWGNTWQDNGFFWISYEEPSLCEFSVFELQDNNNYTSNYHHDTYITNQSMRASSSTVTSYASNIFQAEGDEWLQAISYNFPVADTEYEISVYKNLRQNSNPTSGTKVYTQSGNNHIPGYVTIEFDENITLSEGETFSIVIELTNQDNPYVISIESCVAIIDSDTGEIFDLSNHTKYQQLQDYTNENESFYSSNGRYWTDVKNMEYHYSDAEKTALYNSMLSIYGESYMSSFEENFGDDDVLIAQGNIPIKAFTNPINFVSFSRDSGLVYSDETIELSCENSEIYYSVNGGEYIPYTQPIEITDEFSEYIISATSDFENYSTKEFIPAYSTLNRLGYAFSDNKTAQYVSPDENGIYTINVDESQETIMLLPISQGTVKLNGTETQSYQLSQEIPLEYGENTIEITVETENAVSSTLILKVYRGDVYFLLGDVNSDGYVNASDSSEVLREYALLSSGETGTFTDIQKKAADFNNDGIINASDASEILSFYAQNSSGN